MSRVELDECYVPKMDLGARVIDPFRSDITVTACQPLIMPTRSRLLCEYKL